MSTAAIEQVVNALRGLPESDQQLFLSFVKALKRKRTPEPPAAERPARNPALKKTKDGRLVFTGKLEQPEVDWLQVVRDERDEEFIRQALGQASAS